MSNVKIDPSTLGELETKLVTIKRVTKVTKGGKNMKFTALVVVGDRNGHVGYGLGKSIEIPEAIRKGEEEAKKNMIFVPRDEANSIPYTTKGVAGRASVLLMNAKEGTGIIAGGAMRAVLEVAGVRNVLAKAYGSTNPVNVVRSTVNALRSMKTPEQVAAKRGLTVDQILE